MLFLPTTIPLLFSLKVPFFTFRFSLKNKFQMIGTTSEENTIHLIFDGRKIREEGTFSKEALFQGSISVKVTLFFTHSYFRVVPEEELLFTFTIST